MATQTTQQLPAQYIQDLLTREGTGLFPQVNQALATKYQGYGGQRTADFSADQLRAFELARTNQGTSAGYIDRANTALDQSQQSLNQGTSAGLGAVYNAQQAQAEALGYGRQGLSDARGVQGQATQYGLNQNAAGQAYQQQASDYASGQYDVARGLQGQATQANLQGANRAQSLSDQAGQYGTSGLDLARSYTERSTRGPTAADWAQYQDPYQAQVIEGTVQDLNRQYQVAGTGREAGAVGAGAFGGSRQGVQEAESYRNLADVTGRTVSGLRSAGFDRSLSAIQQQRGREAQAGAQIGQFAQAGASILSNQASQASQLGSQRAGAYGQEAQQYAQLGTQQAGLYNNQAQGAFQAGVQGASLYGQEASGIRQGGIQGAALGSQYGASIAGLGQQSAQLYGGQAQGSQSLAGSLQSLGAYDQQTRAADIGLLSQTGAQQQGQVQSSLDAAYQDFLAQQSYEDPFRRVGFLSDTIRGAPSGQTQITNTPDPSKLSQIAGAGIAAAGLYKAFT